MRLGWGGELTSSDTSREAFGEKLDHINLLEQKAVWLALQAFQDRVAHQTVALMCDNPTVVAYVNKQGGMVLHSLC